MKKIYSLLISNFLFLVSIGQSISPDITNEFCPYSETTFSVMIPGELNSISSDLAQITVQPTSISYDKDANKTTFTFKAKFSDNNQAQTFAVSRKSGAPVNFIFKKIKSLFHLNSTLSCSQLQPSLSLITAPNCQISSFHLTFSKVQYYTEFETTLACFGNITQYEYLLPANWKLNSTTSNGI
jgi:hypothetical protein